MSDRNLKALYFCHTHPNLFLQQHCKSCKRGMCHTCIANNSDYCKSCLNSNHRNSSIYEDTQEVIRVLIFSSLITTIIGSYLYFVPQTTISEDFNETLLIIFYFSVSVISTHYLLKHTSFMDDVRKIPLIGFKLSIVLLIAIIVLGVPVLYILFQIIKIIKQYYLKKQ